MFIKSKTFMPVRKAIGMVSYVFNFCSIVSIALFPTMQISYIVELTAIVHLGDL